MTMLSSLISLNRGTKFVFVFISMKRVERLSESSWLSLLSLLQFAKDGIDASSLKNFLHVAKNLPALQMHMQTNGAFSYSLKAALEKLELYCDDELVKGVEIVVV